MGIYNMYGPNYIQLKIAEPDMAHFNVGDDVPIPDGVYFAYEGVVVVIDGKLAATFDNAFDKWGGWIDPRLFVNKRNPIVPAIPDAEQRLVDAPVECEVDQ